MGLLIGIDMDGVLADFTKKLFKIYNQRHGTSYKPEQMHEHSVVRSFGKEVGDEMELIINERGFFHDIEPYPGAIGVVEILMDAGHTVDICTTAPSFIDAAGVKRINPVGAHDKISWIHHHLPDLSRNITVTRNKHYMHYDMLADDSPKNIKNWCKSNPQGLGLLVTQPWNSDEDTPENAKRAPFQDIIEVAKLWDSKVHGASKE